MAFDQIALFVGIAAFLVIAGIILLHIFSLLTKQDRIRLIRAYRAAPQKTAGVPVLIHGPADSRGNERPAGGDPVAFHATFIMTGGCTLIRKPGDIRPLPDYTSFKLFLTSGDFSVTEAGIRYRVSLISALERMRMGTDYFSGKYRQTLILDGMPENVFDDMVAFEAGIQALAPVFSITETGQSVASSVDSRVLRFTQGQDVPPAIADLLKKKIIRPQPGMEIAVIEFFIPEKKSVWVFGEFDGGNTVRYGEGGAGLSVSFEDPEQAGGSQA